MKKIASLFKRDHEAGGALLKDYHPDAAWVAEGEGEATQKFDGTCCMVRGGKLFKRYDAKKGKTPPVGFEPAQEPDPVTGHHPGWLPVGDGPDEKWHREAFARCVAWTDGTYELCGPKVQGNPEKFDLHTLVAHGSVKLFDAPRTFDELREYLKGRGIEGIVWHRANGDMVKIKAKDFGVSR